jgi:hypothetical protein
MTSTNKPTDDTLTSKVGGRKAMGFYAALGVCFILALSGKAQTEVLALINTLYVAFAGSNVWAKKKEPQPTSQPTPQPTPQPNSMEKP